MGVKGGRVKNGWWLWKEARRVKLKDTTGGVVVFRSERSSINKNERTDGVARLHEESVEYGSVLSVVVKAVDQPLVLGG